MVLFVIKTANFEFASSSLPCGPFFSCMCKIALSKKIAAKTILINEFTFIILQVTCPQTGLQSLKVVVVSWCQGVVCRDLHGNIH